MESNNVDTPESDIITAIYIIILWWTCIQLSALYIEWYIVIKLTSLSAFTRTSLEFSHFSVGSVLTVSSIDRRHCHSHIIPVHAHVHVCIIIIMYM